MRITICFLLMFRAASFLGQQVSASVIRSAAVSYIEVWADIANSSDKPIGLPVCGERAQIPSICFSIKAVQYAENNKWINIPASKSEANVTHLRDHPSKLVAAHNHAMVLLEFKKQDLDLPSGTRLRVPVAIQDSGSATVNSQDAHQSIFLDFELP